MQMLRHWRAAYIQFAVKVGEFSTRIFQEEPAGESEKRSCEVHKQHGDGAQDRRSVLMEE
jgi:hypothetical protein